MSFPTPARSGTATADSSYYIVTSDDVVPIEIYPRTELGAGLGCLIEQEVLGQRNERVPERLSELLQTFGLEWEPLSEPGHMRFLGPAAFMLAQAKSNAAAVATAFFQSLDIPLLQLHGVSLVDPSTPVMSQYLKLTSINGLYGDSPYAVSSDKCSYNLRQTGCFQKFSACLNRSLPSNSLPVALFEISDSFRCEPEETLQLCYRLRRFHLPEAHIHAKNVREATDLSFQLHSRILQVISELEPDIVLFLTATHEFASLNHTYLNQLASQTGSPALLKVTAPGLICEDGVELDVEYKIVDSRGCCRELSTFQIDERITRNFGVRCDDGMTPSTIHSVMTGSIERYLYFVLDRIVRFESASDRRRMPLWMSPVVTRVFPANAPAMEAAVTVAGILGSAGIRTQLDDRHHDLTSAIGHADSLLVPYFVLLREHTAETQVVAVRDFRSGIFKDQTINELVADIRSASAQALPERFERLSRPPLNGSHCSR